LKIFCALSKGTKFVVITTCVPLNITHNFQSHIFKTSNCEEEIKNNIGHEFEKAFGEIKHSLVRRIGAHCGKNQRCPSEDVWRRYPFVKYDTLLAKALQEWGEISRGYPEVWKTIFARQPCSCFCLAC
jgi:hypothetical protein